MEVFSSLRKLEDVTIAPNGDANIKKINPRTIGRS